MSGTSMCAGEAHISRRARTAMPQVSTGRDDEILHANVAHIGG
jgi:hypothetical protein